MSCDCVNPTIYTCTGDGAALLPNASLNWLTTADSTLASTPERSEYPDGRFNELFHKLLQNDCAIANFAVNSLGRTYGAQANVAPAEGVLPGVMTGAPEDPTNWAVHTMLYTNYEVTYRYDSVNTTWVEVARITRVSETVTVRQKKMVIELTEGAEEVPFTIPTTDDNANAFAFTIDDLALMYINNTDEDSPIVGVLPGLNLSGAVVRLLLTAPITTDDYELVVIFRRTVVA